MNYDNITKQGFNDFKENFFDISSYEKLLIKDLDKDYFEIINIKFRKLFEFSHKNELYFLFCSSIVYENTFDERFKEYENRFIDVKKIDFIKKEYEIVVNEYLIFYNTIKWNTYEKDLIETTLNKKKEFLESLLLKYGCKVVSSFNPNSYYQIETNFINLNYSLSEQTPKHENIFCNNGFVLFEHILNEYVKTDRGRLSDIHFFYRSMFKNKPQYIHQPPERFKEWFNSEYDENLGKIKTFNQVDDPDRRKHYSNALEWFKTQF